MLELFIPIVILSWPTGNVPPLVIQGKPSETIELCQTRQEAIMYNFTMKYPEFWQINYVGYCIKKPSEAK